MTLLPSLEITLGKNSSFCLDIYTLLIPCPQFIKRMWGCFDSDFCKGCDSGQKLLTDFFSFQLNLVCLICVSIQIILPSNLFCRLLFLCDPSGQCVHRGGWSGPRNSLPEAGIAARGAGTVAQDSAGARGIHVPGMRAVILFPKPTNKPERKSLLFGSFVSFLANYRMLLSILV